MPFHPARMILDHAAFLLVTRAPRTGWAALIPETEKLAEMGGRILLTLVAAYVVTYVVFRVSFNCDFMQGAAG